LFTRSSHWDGPRFGWRALQRASVCALCLALSGCGNGLAQVSGLVTLDGEPLHGGDNVRATVIFQPASGKGSPAVGILDENGEYRLSTGSQDGIEPGEYVVTCSAAELVPPKNPGGTPGGRRLTDAKYNSAKTSGLSFTVLPGKNNFDIPLESVTKSAKRGR
jgi:hypothetical protein